MKYEGLEREDKMNIQVVRIVADLHVLSLMELDIVLDNTWLEIVDKVMHDYDKMTLYFKLGFKKRIWTILTYIEVNSYEDMMFWKLCKSGAHCFAIILTKEDSLF